MLGLHPSTPHSIRIGYPTE